MAEQVTGEAQPLAEQLLHELGAVMGSLAGGTATVTATVGPFDAGWAIPIQVSGAATGTMTLAVSKADAAQLARLVMGLTGDPDAEVVVDMLREMVGQAVGALQQHPAAAGLTLAAGAPREVSGELPAGWPRVADVALADGFTPRLACWQVTQPAAGQGSRDPARGTLHEAGPAPGAAPADAGPAAPRNLDVILDIDLPLSVRFGLTEMTLEALTRLGPGSVIDLGRSPDDPVEVLVNGRLVARAEVVVVGGNYGVRILEVVSTADRVRSLGA
jgi:flagellar motor switch protein FliN/FliY